MHFSPFMLHGKNTVLIALMKDALAAVVKADSVEEIRIISLIRG